MLPNILASGSTFWMPTRASTIGGDVDWLFYLILWISVFFTLLIFALMMLFVIKYRHREGRAVPDSKAGHSTALELIWTIIPTLIVAIIFIYGFRIFMKMSYAEPNAYEIQVNAQMWSWTFTYPNGHVDNELHIPLNTPIRLVLNSADVIHSFYVPAFRVKKDVVPGRYNTLWFQADQAGEYDVLCAEYCGTQHSQMRSVVYVEDQPVFAKWMEEADKWEGKMSPAEAGRKMVYEKRGCMQCHSLDGTRIIGPSFKDLFGSPVPLADGSTVVADENYIRDSIIKPSSQIVAGYDNNMPASYTNMKEQDIGALIAFLKTISSNYKTLDPASTKPSTQPAAAAPVEPAGGAAGGVH